MKLILTIYFAIISCCAFSQIDNSLLQAVKNNDHQLLDSLIVFGIDVNARNDEGTSLFMLACYYSDHLTLEILYNKRIEDWSQCKGIYEEGFDAYGNRIYIWIGDLISAAYLGEENNGAHNDAKLEFLIDSLEFDVNVQTSHEVDSLSLWTPLMHMCNLGAPSYIYDLIEKGARLDLQNGIGNSAPNLILDKDLRLAVESSDMTRLSKMAEHQDQQTDMFKSYDSGNLYEAIDHGKGAKQLSTELYGHNSVHYLKDLMFLSMLYNTTSNYNEALVLNLEGLRRIEENHQISLIFKDVMLNNTAALYSNLGDQDKALDIFKELLIQMQSDEIRDSTDYAHLLHGLSAVYYRNSQHELAQKYSNQALTIIEHCNPNSRLHATILMGNAVHRKNRDPECLKLISKSFSIDSTIYGGLNGRSLTSYIGKGGAYLTFGKLEESIDILTRAWEMCIELNLEEETFCFNCLWHLSEANDLIGEQELARSQYDALVEICNQHITSTFNYLTENFQLKYYKRLLRWQAALNRYYGIGSIPFELYNYNTSLKGLTIRTFDDQVSKELLRLKRSIALEETKPSSRRHPAITDWREKALELEALEKIKLITESKEWSFDDLQSSLQEDDVIVDIINYRVLGQWGEETDSIIYAAQIIHKGEKQIEFVPLFYETELEDLINRYKASSISKLYELSERGLSVEEEELSLTGLLYRPIAKHLKGARRIIYSPSGLLHKVNIGAIAVDEDKTVLDLYETEQYSNIESFVIKKSISNYNNEVLLLGGIEYGESEMKGEEIGAAIASRGDWKYLKWTKKEVDAIEEVFEIINGHVVSNLGGVAVTEAYVKDRLSHRESSPRVIHFSTHGFFFDDLEIDKENAVPFYSSNNPMVRSGLLLSGSNVSWTGADVFLDGEDNILTANEIQNLNLGNTELVVLSACETGLGSLSNGDGVFGLQRAFKKAGAQNIIMSLWQVPDRATSVFMIEFYKNWQEGKMGIREAFNKTQLEMRDRFFDPYSWAGFVLVE